MVLSDRYCYQSKRIFLFLLAALLFLTDLTSIAYATITSVVGPTSAVGDAPIGVISLVQDPVNPNILYAGSSNNGLYKSADGGNTWSLSSGLPGNSSIASLTIDPVTNSTLYANVFGWAGVGNGIYKSMDSGITWVAINNGLPAENNSTQFYAVAINPSSPSVLYIDAHGTSGGLSAIFTSTNGGTTWSRIAYTGMAPSVVYSFAVDPITPATVYAATDIGGYRSIDGGQTWTGLAIGAIPTRFVFPKGNSSLILAATNGGPFRSIDGGVTWLQTPTCSGSGGCDQTIAFAVNKNNPDVIFAGGTNSAVYLSWDAGQSWSLFETIPPNDEIFGLAFNPITNTIYALSQTQNLYAYTLPAGYFSIPTPTINSITPSSSGAGTFDLTITGSNFDSGAVDQVYTPTGACMGQGTIKSRTSTQIVVTEYMNGTGSGNYTVRVRNSNGQLSNSVTLTIINSVITPTDKFLTYLNPDPSGDTNGAYWIQNNKRYHVIDNTIIDTMKNYSIPGWSWQGVYTVSDTYSSAPDFISTASTSNGMYIRLYGGTDLYKINNGRKEYVSSVACQQVNCWPDVIDVPQAYLDMFSTSSPTAGVIQLPQTGQTTCYDTAGVVILCADTGQDGDIRAGVPWPNQRFMYNGDETVSDNLTGLMWTQDANAPGPSPCSPAVTKTWQGALDYVACLNTNSYLGYTDWHLPNINELESLTNAGQSDSAAWLNTQGFSNVQPDVYWSSTSVAYYFPYNAWFVRMWSGHVSYNGKAFSYYVWPVRSGQMGLAQLWKTGQNTCYDANGEVSSCSGTGQDGDLQAGVVWPTPRFTVGTGIEANCVTDDLTGLMWTKNASLPGSYVNYMNWQQALDYTNGLSLCGHTDWRLPNKKELRSLNDYSQHSPALPPGYPFLNVQSGYYWSSTSNTYSTDYSLFDLTAYGGINDFPKSYNYVYLWPVRGGQVGSTPVITDSDGDGYLSDQDCDDSNTNIHPGATELCNNINDDCDDLKDEDFPNLNTVCSAGTGNCTGSGNYVCSADGTGTVCNATPGLPSPEVCDGVDNNCDDVVDEGCNVDSDGDGLTDAEEAIKGTDLNKEDTDGDGLNDSREINETKTEPLEADTDGDALPDGLEVDGLDGLNLREMGADPLHKDIFVEIDYMVYAGTCDTTKQSCLDGHSHQPKQEGIEKVIKSFWEHEIRLHVDNGPQSMMIPEINTEGSIILNNDETIKSKKKWGNYSRTNSIIETEDNKVLGFDDKPTSCDDYKRLWDELWKRFNEIKDTSNDYGKIFDDNRRKVFHYTIYAHELGIFNPDKDCSPTGRPSGISKWPLPASDFIVSLGSNKDKPEGTIMQQAGTFMHELGHNLGLLHGGDDEVNNKPNYLSVMNYSFQMSGVYASVSTSDGLSSYNKQIFNYSDFDRDNDNEMIDDAEILDLYENNLDERTGLNGTKLINNYITIYYGHGENCPNNIKLSGNVTDPIDWNCNTNYKETGVHADINKESNPTLLGGVSQFTVLHSYNDWRNLKFTGGKERPIGQAGVLGQSIIEQPAPVEFAPFIMNELTPEEDSLIPKLFAVTVTNPGSQTVLQGTTTNSIFKIINKGEEPDVYTLTATSDRAWSNVVDMPSIVQLEPGEEAEIEIQTIIPVTALNNESDEIVITATSTGNPGLMDKSTVIITTFDGIPPIISYNVTPISNATGWYNSDVTVTFTCSDTGSGIQTCPDPVTIDTDGANQIITGTVIDRGGNSSSTSITINLDKTLPAISTSLSIAPNAYGWYTTDVIVTFTCSDSDSGIAICPDPLTVSTEGAGQVVAGTAVDVAGNSASTSVTINLDRTSPFISSILSSSPNASGWHNSDVTVSFICSDDESGIATCPDPATVYTEGRYQVVAGTTMDKAGNIASVSLLVSLDKTPPVLTMPTLDSAYLYIAPVDFNFNAQDSLSGLIDYYATLSGIAINNGTVMALTKLGTNTFTLTATDLAGNTYTQTATFEVHYTFSGLLPPIQADGSKVFKIGSTIPVKFQLKDANDASLSTAKATLTLQQYSNDVPSGDPIIVESTSETDMGNMFRYDFDSEQYIFNLNTKGLSQGLWQLQVHLDDETVKAGFIKLK